MKIKLAIFCTFVALFFAANFAFATTSTITCDTTSSLTIPGAQNPYSMNFNCAVPSGASTTASLEINWLTVGNHDNRDYFNCGGSTLYTTGNSPGTIMNPPVTVTTDVSTCLRGYNLTTGNRICTANAWNTNCGGYYYGLAAGHSTMGYARLSVTYTDAAPSVLAFTPADNNTTFNMTDNLVISFDRATYVGTGSIVIKKGSDNSIVETIDVTSVKVTGSGTATITINPDTDLVKNTAYYVQIDNTAFNDNKGNNYAGISNTTSWNFTTLNIIPPTTQATNLTFTNVANTSLTLSWTNGNGAGRMVFAKRADTGTAAPVDYTNYTASSVFGSGSQIGSSGWFAVYGGTGSSVSVTNLSYQTAYIFQVIEYNTTAGQKAYFTNTATNNPSVAYITSTTYDTTSSLTIPGAQNAYSMNFAVAVPSGATASLEIKWTNVGNNDNRDYFMCGGSILYTTGNSPGTIMPPYPKTVTTDVSTCVKGRDLTSGNRICTANAWNTSCGGYYYGLAAGHSTMEYARLIVTYSGTPPTTYTITYNGNGNNGGSAPTDASSPYNSGSTVTVLGNTGSLAKTAYSFNGWNTAADGSGTSYDAGSTFTIAANTTLYAQWSALPTYTVAFNGNDADSGSVPDSQTKIQGIDLTISGNTGNLARAGCTFNGWNTAADGSGTSYSASATYSADAGTTLYAQWSVNDYTVTFDKNGGDTNANPSSVGAVYNSTVTLPTSPSRAGYTFASWNTAADGSGDSFTSLTPVTADITVYAQWEVVTYSTFYANSSTGNDATGNGSSQNPYKTFHKAYTMASSGDVLDLTGTFSWTDANETGDATINGYTIGKNLTIQGHGPDQTILQASSIDNNADRRVLTISPSITVTIKNLAIRYGRVNSTSADGGGILNKGTATIEDCEIYNNRAPGSYGGGISNWNKMTITRCSIYNNVANYMGGGVLNSYYVAADGYLNIANSTIAYNQVTATTAYRDGGGVHCRKGDGSIINSTIAYNTACDGGGLGVDNPSGTVTIKNNIIASNYQIAHSYCNNGLVPKDFNYRYYGTSNVVDSGYNIIGYSPNYTFDNATDWIINRGRTAFVLNGNPGSSGSLNLDASLAINGNASKTQTLALKSGSIAINNAGSGAGVPSADQRGNNRTGNPDIGSFEYEGAPADTTAPIISDILATASDNSATITWATNEEASSQVKYDPSSYLTTRTPVYDSAVRTIGHEVLLSNLVACSKYYYAVISQDSAGNVAISSVQSFTTTGCVGRTSISNVSELVFTPAVVNGAEVDEAVATASDSDYSVSHVSGNLTFGLNIPRTFSDVPASLQIKDLSATDAIGSLSRPTNYNNIGSSVFDIKALSDPSTTVSTTSSAVTVTLSYTAGDVVGIDESTLKIYRNEDDGNGWHALDNCTVNTTAKTVTCTTTSFSVFGLFGAESASPATPAAASGGSIPIYVLQQISEDARIKQLKTQIAELQKQIAEILAKKQLFFTRDLYLGMAGQDVKQLQVFLNKNGFLVAEEGDGSPGKETDFFGLGTKSALIKFQKAKNISPAAGFFGPTTRGFVNKMSN